MKDAQLTIRVTSEQKQRWKEHADNNPQYDDRTELITDAVEEQIAEDSDDYNPQNDVRQVLASIEEVDEKITNIQQELEETRAEQATSVQLDASVSRLQSFLNRGDDNE